MTGLVDVVVIADVEVDAPATVARVAGLGSSRPFLACLLCLLDGGSFLFQNSIPFCLALYVVCAAAPRTVWNMLVGRPHHAECASLPEQPSHPLL